MLVAKYRHIEQSLCSLLAQWLTRHTSPVQSLTKTGVTYSAGYPIEHLKVAHLLFSDIACHGFLLAGSVIGAPLDLLVPSK